MISAPGPSCLPALANGSWTWTYTLPSLAVLICLSAPKLECNPAPKYLEFVHFLHCSEFHCIQTKALSAVIPLSLELQRMRCQLNR
jgi:hypothetical protein